MEERLKLIEETKKKRKISLIQEEIERYDLMGECFSHNPLKVRQSIFSAICWRLDSLKINREISDSCRKYAGEVMDFYRDISSYRLEEILNFHQGDKNAS